MIDNTFSKILTNSILYIKMIQDMKWKNGKFVNLGRMIIYPSLNSNLRNKRTQCVDYSLKVNEHETKSVIFYF